ncbi:head-specific guanylate cyclase isoform X2 [Diorhabda carinulata]|uniref:head-specific guanylate cyclase isoform X2 n=1 Tax=Diorhabda carinulata TaxID=1163345 RepID=UPI0025A090B7|nr:head-specific guanylate cyclase isoform X2 [Diorhabda carinulata]XP_057661492.1 head-specific guanylate cyclase isoform X2 [Diorhabda carinulata]XP_057661493.1 head-specific guanylate cyclase isoform X2 [Diorhabda carinulata]XP_057661494.1 head-specific guanylate cyclase isoform X2 [Diorhabda carinulata]XP_057661495.1 head-specific guanylate cyclase isoform X2 [Diorhabda carinulata]
MSCPFQRPFGTSNVQNGGAALKRSFTTKQNSIQINDDQFEEDRNTLNLKHLNEAILILTCPTNEAVQQGLASLIVKQSPANRYRYRCLDRLPQNVKTCSHYAYLDDLYDVVKCENDIDVSLFFDSLGQELIMSSLTGRTERAFMCLGGNLKEFLTTLDGVYDVLKYQENGRENGHEAEAFVCTVIDADNLQLDFTTEKPAVAYLFVGCLKAIGRILYNTQIEIVLNQDIVDKRHFRFKISLKSPATRALISDKPAPDYSSSKLQMGVSTFCKAFPWHFVLDHRLEFVQLGSGFMRLFGQFLNTCGASVSTYFEFQRPRNITLSFNEIVKRANTPFLLSIKKLSTKGDFTAEDLKLKGQMVFCPESNSILFIGSPFIDGLEGLTGSGLFISDIPLHDATRDVILVGEQARAQDGLRRRMDKLKSSIEEANRAVDKEREKNVSLLHLIFPPDIAKRLWLGETIEAKTYEDVTMLFSDIVGFTSICSTATPMMVINMLQNLYNKFDIFCGQIDVYKVETIGDAYCVAGGLHKETNTHAQQIAWMALKMIEVCSLHQTHQGQPIKMRIGIHTAPVLAGVVGVKMPRYCMFGHNVTIANKFESTSEPLKINISPTTFVRLIRAGGFITEERDVTCLPKGFPSHIPGTCHFLTGYKHQDVDENATMAEHIEAGLLDIGLKWDHTS